MGIKLSHSAKNRYLSCGESYRLHYLEKLRPKLLSSALLFGSSIDLALNYLLLNKNDLNVVKQSIKLFNNNWEQNEDQNKQKIDLPLNPNIRYYKGDYQPDMLESSEWQEIFKKEKNFFDLKNEVDELAKSTDWLDIPEEKRMIYNYAHWLCLQKKGTMLIEAFAKEILPQIKEVLAVQMDIQLEDEDGNIFTGVIDYVAKLSDGKIYIMDNKTSSTEYEEDSVKLSEQLATYYAILNIFADDPNHSWKHKIDGCGYSVLSKKIQVETTKKCKECGHIGEGSHKTCDNVINKERCNGEWSKDKKFKVKTQLLTGTISEQYAQEVLENATTVKSCIELGLFPKNYTQCDSMFGQKCPYINYCHKNDKKGLVDLK